MLKAMLFTGMRFWQLAKCYPLQRQERMYLHPHGLKDKGNKPHHAQLPLP
jgi:transposase